MAKSISDKIAELKEGVDWFYSDDFKLEDASDKYKALTGLAKEIEKDLDELKNEIKVRIRWVDFRQCRAKNQCHKIMATMVLVVATWTQRLQ